MSHDASFAEFVARKRDREAAEAAVRVTWRRVALDAASGFPAGGWSGIGAGGALVYVRPFPTGGYELGRIVEGRRVRARRGFRPTVGEAKAAAAALLSTTTKETR